MSQGYRKSFRRRKLRRVKRSQPRKIARQATAAAQELQLPLNVEGLLEMASDSLASFAAEMGMLVAQRLLEDEVTRRCGARHARDPQREVTRFGHQSGYVTLAGQKATISKPRIRYVDGRGESELECYALLQSPQAMPEAAMKRMINGVSTRRYEHVVELARAGFGVKKSSVSRSFVRASAHEVQQLAERRFDDEHFIVILIDAQAYGGEMMLTALGITASGEKKLLGVRQGATENAEVTAALLEELRERGVKTDRPTLFVLDGAKALTAAVRRVWGKYAVIQRCQIHKRRNVEAHLAAEHHEELRRRLNLAYHETNEAQARVHLQATIRWLRKISPAAAASLEEGWQETLTVVRLNVPALLRKTLATTNPIESAFSVAESVTQRVKRWRDGDMRQRWCIAGLLDAESRFRRVKGHRQLAQLRQALEHEVQPQIDKRPQLDNAKQRAS